jgi:uncharacterized repeat protein (TIGR01451 family)
MARKVIGPTGSRRRRWFLLMCLVVTVGAGVFFIPYALALVSDTGTADITVADKNHSAGPVTLGSGASVEYIGSSAQNQASGTGLFDPFVRLQGGPVEKGYNTDGAVAFDTKAGTWTHAIKVNAIPLVDCDGSGPGTATCWELFNDINENNTAKRISLNVVELWFTTNPNLVGFVDPTGFPAASGATKEYQFNGNILINDVNQGSGRGDLRYLIPTAGHTWDDNTYFVLYSKWGTTTGTAGNNGTGTYVADGGFEEWKVRKVPNVHILKTANPAGPVSAGTNIGFDITVSNTGVADATNVVISDPLPAGAGNDLNWSLSPAFSGCSITGSVGSQTLNCTFATLAAGASKGPIHITSATTGQDCAVVSNTAMVSTGNDGSGSSTDNVTVQCPDVKVLKTPDSEATGPGTVTAGSNAVFTIVTSNIGTGTAKSVTLTDNLPAGTSLDWSIDTDATGLCGITGSVGSEVLTCHYGDLAPNASRTVIVKAATSAGDCTINSTDNTGDIVNTASASATNESTATLTNNSDHGDVNVQCPDVQVVKTPDSEATGPGTVTAGSDAVFTIVTTNNGPGTAKSVTTTDNLPAGSSLDWSIDTDVTGDCAIAGSVGSEVLTCDYGDMASGTSHTVIVKATTSAGDCTLNGTTGDIENTAGTSADNESSTTLDNNSDHGDVNVECAAIQILKESTKTGNPLVLVDGAVFHVTGPGGYSADVTDNGLTDEDLSTGSVCISGLAPGEYTVTETTPPDGYGSGTAVDGTATAADGTDCGSNKPTAAQSAIFTDPPLYDLQVNFRDGGSGETSATIACDPGDPPDSTTAASGWDTSSTYLDRSAPDTINCTITVDP